MREATEKSSTPAKEWQSGEQPAGAQSAAESCPFVLAGAERYLLGGPGGTHYWLDVAVPEGAPPAGGWPLALLLDGAGCFATAVEALRRMSRRPDATGVEPLLVAAVSVANADRAARQRDFTSERAGEPGSGDAGSGGAPAFLSFLEKEVKPLVSSLAPLAAGRQTLFGHSLAGYFALWVLASRPHAFRTYVAVSPSVWWDPDGLANALQRAPLDGQRALLLAGEWEDSLPPWQQAQPDAAAVAQRRRQRRMVDRARFVADLLQQRLGGEGARFRLLAEEDHASILSAAIPAMLRLASRP